VHQGATTLLCMMLIWGAGSDLETVTSTVQPRPH